MKYYNNEALQVERRKVKIAESEEREQKRVARQKAFRKWILENPGKSHWDFLTEYDGRV